MFLMETFLTRNPSGSHSTTLRFSARPGPTCHHKEVLSLDEDITRRPSTADGAVTMVVWTGLVLLPPDEATTLIVYMVPDCRELNLVSGTDEPRTLVLRENPDQLSSRAT